MSSGALLTSPRHAPSGVPGRRNRHSAVGGPERRRATVLFVDVTGSMGLSGTVELEEWWAAIDDLFTLLCEGVHRHGGWVASFTGDGIEAVFDDCAEPPEESARRACEAARWLCDAVRQRGAEMWRAHGLELSVRTGIHSGEILVGMLGDRRDGRYTTAGFAVGLAKRIEGLATPGRAWMSEQTAALVAETVAVRERGAYEVKGAPAPVRVFELA